MKNGINKIIFSIVLLFSADILSAQAGNGSSSVLIYTLMAVAVLVFFFLLVQVSDNLLAIEAKQTGANKTGANFGIFPKLSEIFSAPIPGYTGDLPVHNLKQGHDILLEGEATGAVEDVQGKTFAVQPPNFRGLSPIPKLEVEVGSEVKAGDVLLYDKKNPAVKYVAPVSGEVIAINRGAKRAITEVVILADKEQSYRSFDAIDLENTTREDLVNFLLDSGAWPLITQRPFSVVADHNVVPTNIFISTFDTAPLAPDQNVVVDGQGAAFQKGLDVLNKLTDGTVYLGLDANREEAPSSVFTNAEGVESQYFRGKHPSGNVGVQIHHTAPIGNNDKVWTLGVQDVLTLGRLFLDGRYDVTRVIAVTGAELKAPKYVRTKLGANINDLVDGNLGDDNLRFVSGDVLSGQQKSADGFLNAQDDQLTVLQEGDYYEMFGWLIPVDPRPSISNTFPNFLFPDLKFRANTNTHGEERAFVVTGQYEKVLPMDIYPQHLMKAILVNDFERMEGLGILELSEEDIALCEFVCTSKQPLQSILRQGLDVMREQG